MSIGDAQKFIQGLITNSDFRSEFYKISNKSDWNHFLSDYGLRFTQEEWEDGYNNLFLNCQHESLAELYSQSGIIYHSVLKEIDNP